MSSKGKGFVERYRLFAVLRALSAQAAVSAGLAAYRSGARVIEITFTVPQAGEVISRRQSGWEKPSFPSRRSARMTSSGYRTWLGALCSGAGVTGAQAAAKRERAKRACADATKLS